MMENRQITCVVCPKGCSIKVCIENGGISAITGSGCERGVEYAGAECTNPVRTLTTTARVEGGRHPIVPVKSDRPLPKGLLRDAVREINKYTVKAPVKAGDVVIANILGTGVNIIATGSMYINRNNDIT